jgi:putative membrane protein
MTIHIRTIALCVWTSVRETDGKDVIGKVTCLNLLVAYAVAIKHHLREEYSSDYNDIKELVASIPEFKRRPYEHPSTERRNDMSFVAHCISPPSNVPIEVLYYIKSYLTSVSENGQLAKSSSRSVQEAMRGLLDCFTGFEKILNTPIPLAYAVHLHHILWIFILTMPIQLMQELVWWSIPVVGLTSFSLLGILGINWEIDNPFGYDYNDLPLDEYCTVLRHEIQEITFNRIRPYDDWAFTSKNSPMWPLSAKNAQDMANFSTEQVHEILIKCANAVPIEVNSSSAGHDNPGYH